MWIKASGTELANAVDQDIFVEVDVAGARAEAYGAGDGSCKATVLDREATLRPSIETTFHAALPGAVVAHTHSIATLTHVVSPQGRSVAKGKLSGLPFVMVPYAKPGLPLTTKILARISDDTRIILLENHGLIVFGETVEEVSDRIEDVERRLRMPERRPRSNTPEGAPPDGRVWAAESWIANTPRAFELACAGSYYPDHVVFLGPGLPVGEAGDDRPATLIEEQGVAIRDVATESQKAMLTCLSDILIRLPDEWEVEPIGPDAEAELLDWDAEKYRQALAER